MEMVYGQFNQSLQTGDVWRGEPSFAIHSITCCGIVGLLRKHNLALKCSFGHQCLVFCRHSVLEVGLLP